MPTDIETTILTLERVALERWGQGDPDGFLEISAPDVSYFDPFTESRLDGIDAPRHEVREDGRAGGGDQNHVFEPDVDLFRRNHQPPRRAAAPFETGGSPSLILRRKSCLPYGCSSWADGFVEHSARDPRGSEVPPHDIS